MLILGIESSCDDTSVALVEANENGFVVLAEKTASQIDVHKKYGGVVPEIAGRCHAENILPVIESVLDEAQSKILDDHGNPGNLSSIFSRIFSKKYKNKKNSDHPDNQDSPGLIPDVIAVTSGPGLITGLIVGVEAAKSLSLLWDVPIVKVNHIEGHIHSVLIQNTRKQETNKSQLPITNYQLPCLCLTVSGGHTELILIKKQGQYEKIGGTIDDAAGEAFDKVGKLLGFEYPGGPKVSKHAETGNPKAIKFPRPLLNKDNFDFSFAGLKTSALYWLRDNKLSAFKINPVQLPAGISGIQKEEITVADFCASFEQAIVDVLVAKTLKAIEKHQPKTVILAGGVSANKKLRKTLEKEIKDKFPLSSFLLPHSTYSMDNAAMIAVSAYHHALKKDFTNWKDLQADPNWKLAR